MLIIEQRIQPERFICPHRQTDDQRKTSLRERHTFFTSVVSQHLNQNNETCCDRSRIDEVPEKKNETETSMRELFELEENLLFIKKRESAIQSLENRNIDDEQNVTEQTARTIRVGTPRSKENHRWLNECA